MKAFVAILALACLFPLALAGDCDADQFKVGSYVYLDKASFFSGDKFTFYIAIPPSNSNPVFAFNSATAGCLAADLTWTKVAAPDGSDAKADTCTPDVYKSEIQWSTLHASCGGVRDNSDATDLIWTYNLLISFEQSLNANDAADDQAFAFTRYIKSARRIVVRFPKQISASVTTTVTNMLTDTRIPAQAALSRITVDNTSPGINTFLTLEITTAVTYPDIVSTPSLVSILDSAGISRGSDLGISTDGFTLVTDDCVSAPGKVCRQKWTFKINQKSDLCGATATVTDGATANFTATYKVKFPVTCQSAYQYAPECPANDYFEMDAKVATANICPIVRSALLSATLTADSSSGYKLRKTPVFTLVTSSSTATISATSLVSVVMSQKAADINIADITLWSSSAITDAGTVAGFKRANSGAKLDGATSNNAATTVTFSAKLMPSQIVLPSTASRDVKFTATVAVTFLNTESFGAPTVSRRLLAVELPVNDRTHIHSLLSKGSDKLVASSEFKVSGEDAQEFSAVAATASSASTAIVTPLVMLLSFVVALFNLLA